MAKSAFGVDHVEVSKRLTLPASSKALKAGKHTAESVTYGHRNGKMVELSQTLARGGKRKKG